MKRLISLALCLAAPAAFAHPGHATAGFFAGLLHPLLGIDHLLALVGAGLWAAQRGGRARIGVASGFVAALALGFALALGGFAVPGVEPGIAASVLVFGLLLAGGTALPVLPGVALASAFALLHGYAHGAELPVGGQTVAYAAGLLGTSAVTMGFAMTLGVWLNRAGSLAGLRTLGAGIAAAGVVLLAGL